jgi:hypothetical protein
MLLSDNDISMSERDVQELTGTGSQSGGGMENVPGALNQAGVSTPYQFVQNATLGVLRSATAAGNSAIVSISTGLYATHAMVLDGFGEDSSALVRDPWPFQGAYGIPLNRFIELFTGRAVIPTP